MTTTQIRFVLQAVTTESSPPQLELVLHPKLTMYTSRETGTGNSTPQSGSPQQTFAPQDSSGSPGSLWSGGNQLGGGGYGGIGNPSSLDGMNGGATTSPPAPPQQGNSDPVTFANQLTCDFQKIGAMLTVNHPNQVDVIITNRASVPFEKGRIKINLTEGLGFLNDANVWVVDGNGRHILEQDYLITDNSSNRSEIAIQPGGSYTMSVTIAPYKTGNMTVRATVLGQSPILGWAEIEGAQRPRTFNVVSQ
jgi:hypothetical protein